MRRLKNDQNASVKMIGVVAGLFVTLAVAILVFYSLAGGIDTTTLDTNFGVLNTTPVLNATDATLDQAATFFTIAPLIGIVIVAVVILGYVGKIGE